MLDLPGGTEYLTSNGQKDVDFSSLLAHPDSTVWESIFDSLPDMVALIDLNNIVVKANKAMLQKLKIGDRGIVGNTCNNLMHNRGCTLENCPHLSMIKDNRIHSIDLFEPKFNAYLNITTTPIFDTHKNLIGSLHIARDITKEKESEDKLKKFNSELKELNQSKDKFFSIVAHDLRSPFQGMLGFTDLILDELDTLSKEEIREYVQKVHDSSYSTFTLLENLLNWSRLQTGRLQYKPVEVNINDEISAIISLLASNAQSKNISLINNISGDYHVIADQQMVHSMLLNLTTNAIKFSFNGGTVTFSANVISTCEPDESNHGYCENTSLEISISDNGVGISEEDRLKLFKLDGQFSLLGTANEQGAGLGLILVKEMTEKQGGKLTVRSEPNKGSTFSFTLNLAKTGQ
jgi:PAS domain S-box-containing protein